MTTQRRLLGDRKRKWLASCHSDSVKSIYPVKILQVLEKSRGSVRSTNHREMIHVLKSESSAVKEDHLLLMH